MSLDRGSTGAAASASASDPKPPTAPKARRRARGKGNLADQYCVYGGLDGQNVAVLVIEYKAPHKLSVDEVVTGLELEIFPERDLFRKDRQDSTRLAAAVVTQLLSYMIGRGIQYGYVSTRKAIVFLHIPNDPATVEFSICVPERVVVRDDGTGLLLTAAAQVFAFLIQALRTEPPTDWWFEEADKLGKWPDGLEPEITVESDDSATEGKRKEPSDALYKPQRSRFVRSKRISTRSRNKDPESESIW